MSELPRLANKARTLAFRDSVVLALHEHGVDAARRPELDLSLSGARRQAVDRGAVEGLPWTINVHRQQTMDLSGSLDKVRERAVTDGSERYACIHHRKGHGVADAYVVMPLTVFARTIGSGL